MIPSSINYSRGLVKDIKRMLQVQGGRRLAGICRRVANRRTRSASPHDSRWGRTPVRLIDDCVRAKNFRRLDGVARLCRRESGKKSTIGVTPA
jgi:hypothetical protein